MSLDVYLHESAPDIDRGAKRVIFVREDGQTKELSRAEWDERYPGREPVTVECSFDGEVYAANITHNLGAMAEAAGIYKALWRPEDIGVTVARQLIGPLADGLGLLRADAPKFRAHNPPNGWGNYEGFVNFVERYLETCRAHPNAIVSVSR